jgi:hypothetical protein
MMMIEGRRDKKTNMELEPYYGPDLTHMEKIRKMQSMQ